MPSLAHNTIFNAIGSAAMLGSGFATTLVAARILGPEAMGLVAFATLIVTLSLAVLDLGLPGAMMRFLPELRASGGGRERSVAATALVPYAVLSCVSALGLFAGMQVLHVDLGASPTLVAALIAGAVALQSLAAFHYGVLKGQQKFAQFAVLASAAGIMQVGLALGLARSFGVPGILGAILLAFMLPASAALLELRHARLTPGLDILRRVLFYSAQTWAIYVFTTVSWSRLEVYFLRQNWGDHAAGIFSAGLNLANLALQGPMFLTGALLPHLVTKHVDDPHSLGPAFARGLTLFALAVVPMTFVGAALCPILLPLLFGARFNDGITSATILVAGNAAMAVIAIVQQFAFASERTSALLAWSATTAVLTVLSGMTLIAAYGVVGAAAGRAILLAASAIVLLALAHRWRWPVPYKNLALIFAGSAAAAAILGFGVRRWIS